MGGVQTSCSNLAGTPSAASLFCRGRSLAAAMPYTRSSASMWRVSALQAGRTTCTTGTPRVRARKRSGRTSSPTAAAREPVAPAWLTKHPLAHHISSAPWIIRCPHVSVALTVRAAAPRFLPANGRDD